MDSDTNNFIAEMRWWAAVVRVRKVPMNHKGLMANLQGILVRTVELVFAKDADDPALNLHIVGGHHDRRHFRIRGLQTDFARAFAIEALKGRVFATNQRDH